MNEENLEVKEMPEIPEEILKAALRGELVMFIGAGVSRILGCPSWRELAISYLKEIYKKNSITYFEYKKLEILEPRKLLSICKNICKQKNINISLQALLKPNDSANKEYGDIYEYIYDAGVIYVTTNFDDFLDRALEKNKKKRRDSVQKGNEPEIIFAKDDLLITKLTPGNIIHLHGCLKNLQGLVITISDYLEHYKSEEVITFLEELFQKYTVLFVGYGLEEYEILEFLVHKSKVGRKELKHYMLFPIFQQEKDVLKFYKSYYADLGIKLIPYAIDTKGYEQLYDILKEWCQEIKKYARKKPFLEEIKLIEEVVK